MKIIQEIERGKSKSDVARELGLASSTVATIWKNRVSITESWRNRDMMQSDGDADIQIGKKSTNIMMAGHQPPSALVHHVNLGGPLAMSTPPITTSPSSIALSGCPTTPSSTCSSIPTSPSMIVVQPQDNIQQGQTQTQNQELLEVRMTLYPLKSVLNRAFSLHRKNFQNIYYIDRKRKKSSDLSYHDHAYFYLVIYLVT